MEPIFILGCPRSGTTLMALLLRCSTYGVPAESHFIPKYYRRLGCYGDLSQRKAFLRLFRDILGERSVQQWHLDIDPEAIFARLSVHSYRAIIDQICLNRSQRHGNLSWGDKTPDYLLHLEILYALFPRSRYIYIVRDGRDVALSLMGRAWGPNNMMSAADYWRRCNARSPVLEHLTQEGQLHFLQYETLLRDPLRTLGAVYEFLEQPQDPATLRALVQDIQGNNCDKWRRAMSPRQIAVFERVAGETLERFGYETTHAEQPLGRLERPLYHLHDLLHRGEFLFKTNVIDGVRIRFHGKEPFAE